MSAVVVDSGPAATENAPPSRTALRAGVLAASGASALAVAATARSVTGLEGIGPILVVHTALVVAWAMAAVAATTSRATLRVSPVAAAVAIFGGAAMLADSAGSVPNTTTAAETVAAALAGLAAGGLLHLLVGLPRGELGTPGRWLLAVFGYLAGAAVGSAVARAESPSPWPWMLLGVLFVSCGAAAGHVRYRAATGVDRRRFQWIGWALATTVVVAFAVAAFGVVADWPPQPWVVVLAATASLPMALAASTSRRLLARVDRLLAQTVSWAGLMLLVLGSYVVVVLGLGRSPDGDERALLLASMAAAAVAALCFVPAQRRLTEFANRLVYGERSAPDEALRTWASRLTRAVPLDELLLQLVESLRAGLGLEVAEIWTGTDGRLDVTAGVPHRRVTPVTVGEKERAVVVRAGISGGTWLEVWLPDLVVHRDPSLVRVAPIAHGGELLGLIVVERPANSDPPSDEDDRVLVELARQVGLALHNVQLDSALQQSLMELQQANDELRQSRLRLVNAGDAERRRLERDLHDGAQQHLVAMAVKLRLAEDLTEEDPVEATSVIGELRSDLRDAIAELRALAHGIFPPLLSSGGLVEALPAAAGRNALPTMVDHSGVGRYPPEVEAAVYFCCLEAMQNASKHAGEGASVVVALGDDGGTLSFEVRDDGAGFPLDGEAAGHGFVNMADRLGAVGGRLRVESVPGGGTRVSGTVPVGG